jgi:hypothetical protein
MNYLHRFIEFSTIEEGEANLKDAESIRDKMGGALYYNIMSDDCEEIRKKLEEMKKDKAGE